MKIRTLGDELFHEKRKMDGQTEKTKLIVFMFVAPCIPSDNKE
jgi:hypothetical protein